MPADFPYQGEHPLNPWKNKRFLSLESLKTVDLPGITLLLVASVLLLVAVNEGGSVDHTWSSALVIAFLIISILLWLAFFGWEYYISTHEKGAQEPLFPWQLLRSRVFLGMLG